MLNIFKRKTVQKIHSIFTIFLLLFQNLTPALLLYAVPTPVLASQSQPVSIHDVQLGFDNVSNELELSGKANSQFDYTVVYQTDEEDSISKSVTGQAEVSDDTFSKTIYLGTCSTDECIDDEFDQGSLTLNQDEYEADFAMHDGVLWLEHKNIFSIAQVEKNKTYTAPQNDQVQITFTSLPDKPGSLSIEEVTLSDDQVAQLGALSNKAYDITSSMEDGSFEYDLVLPMPINSDEDIQVVYVEDKADLDEATKAEAVEQVVKSDDQATVKVDQLDHMTIFVVVNPNSAGNGNVCTVASISGTCYDTLQEAVDVAHSGDTIEIASDLILTQEVSVNNINLIIDGNGNTITSPFIKTTNSNNAAFGIYGSNITIKDLIIDGVGSTNLHGVNVYVADSILLDNITVKNFGHTGVVVNSSNVTVNNITTAGNGWHGINVDQSTGNPAASLVVNGYSSHDEVSNVLTGVHQDIYVDDMTKSVSVTDTISQYSFTQPYLPFVQTGIYSLQDIAPSQATGMRILDHNGMDLGCGGATNNRTITVDWNDNPESDINHYDYMIREENIIAHPTASELTGNIRNTDGDYKYRVRAVDNANQTGPWSEWCSVTLDRSVPSSPTQTGYNEDNGDAYSTPRPINELTCTGDSTNINGISIHWTDVTATGSHIKYQRQYSVGTGSWSGNEVYTNPYTNYRTFGGSVGNEGIYGSRVRAWEDYNDNNIIDSNENVSNWSNECSVTFDKTAPAVPTGLRRLAKEDHSIVFACGDFSQTRHMHPDWDDNTDADFDYYEYSSFNAPNGAIGINERRFDDSIFEYNGSWLPNEGTYGFAVRAVDTTGNKSAWAVGGTESFADSCKITYDDTAPDAPSLVEPTNNSIVNGAVLLSDWTTVSDADHYIYESYHDAAATNLRWHAEYTNSEKTATNVSNATFWWRVKAVDAAGNESAWSDLWKVTIDNDAPAITLNLPIQDSFQRGDINLQATCNEDCDYINFWWRAAGESYSNVSPDRRYHYEYDNGTVFNWTLDSLNAERWGGDPNYIMADGDYYFYAAGKDLAGNWARTPGERKITIDNTKPNLAVITPADDSHIAGAFTISGTASDTGSGVKDIRVRFRKESDNSLMATFWATYDSNADTWSLDMNDGVNTIPDGNYKIVVRARDELNNRRFRSVRRVLVDSTAPSATIDSIKYPNGTIESGKFITNFDQPTILGTATDNNPLAADSVVLTINSHNYTATLSGNDWQADVTDDIPDGLYTMTLTVTDVANNVTTKTQDIRIDTVAPTATYQQFDGTTEVTGSVPQVNSLSRLSFTGEYLDNDPSASLYWDSYAIFEAQDDGSFAFSQNGKQAFCSWRSAPNLVDISDGNTFSLTTPEPFTNCESSLVDGEYYMAHHVYDTATRKDIPSINQFRDVLGLHFIIDHTKPTVSATVVLTNPDGDNNWYRTQPVITLTASDNNDVDHIEYHWDSATWTTYVSSLGSAEGTHTLYYRAYDKAGNISDEGSTTVKFDQTAPDPGPKNLTISDLSLPTANLSWDAATDATSGVDRYSISWKLKSDPNAQTYGKTVGADITSVQLDNLKDGEWEIAVRAIDRAGNRTKTVMLHTIGGATETTSSVLGAITGLGGRVFGATTQNEDEVTTSTDQDKEQSKTSEKTIGEVKGVTTSCSGWMQYLPIIILLIQALVIFGLSLFVSSSMQLKHAIALAITLASIFFFWYFSRMDSFCTPSGSWLEYLDHYYWMFATIVGVILRALGVVATDSD